MRFLLKICLVAIFAAIVPAFGEEDATQPGGPLPDIEAAAPAPAAEAPSSRVGRLSLVSGNVSFRVTGETAWADAGVNLPVATGQSLRTDPQARAEIRIGANTIGLYNGTEIEIFSLRDQVTQIAVPQGRIGLDLPQLGEGESVEIDLPRGGVWLLQPGHYDIGAGGRDQPSRVAVFEGGARFVGNGADIGIKAGNMALLTGSGPITATTEPAELDAVGEWCCSRAYDETHLVAPYYISPHMTGFEELDSAGTWESSTEYGEVWYPNAVPANWAPYRYGHWSWVAPWGWTWIDDEPWGFAPFHYGRWALIDGRWAWVPGTFVALPIYAPAVVAFLGTPGIGLSYAEGAAVGWFPLAPGEAYWPSYTRDLNYVRNLNLGNVRDVEAIRLQADGEPPLEVFTGRFANRQFASVVPRRVFVDGRAIVPALLTLPEQRLQNAPVLMGSPQILPASPHRVAAAATAIPRGGRKSAPAIHVAAAVPRAASGAKAVHTAAPHPRGHGQASPVRGAHLRAPAFAGPSRSRHVIVLRMAHAPPNAAHTGARKGMRR